MGVWRKVKFEKGVPWNFLCTVKFCSWIYFQSWTSKTGGLSSWVFLKLANWAVWGRVSKEKVSFYSLLTKNVSVFSSGDCKGVSQWVLGTHLSFPKRLLQSVPNPKSCVSVFTLASTIQSNTVPIKAHQWFGSFASLCFPLELWNKRWWEIAEICQNTLFLCKIIQTYLFKCSWKLPGRYSQMLIETSCAPKVVFRKKGRLQSVKNVVRKLSEL